jgi:hypothetical protein
MEHVATIMTRRRGSVDFSRPVEGSWRGAVGTLSGALLSAAVSVVVLLRPGFDLFPDAFVWMGCGAAIALGSTGVSAALSGIERIVSFETATATVIEELRTRFGAGMRRRLAVEGRARLGALREDLGGASLWHLLLIDGRNGSTIEIGDFADEASMRASAAAIAAVRPDIALG